MEPGWTITMDMWPLPEPPEPEKAPAEAHGSDEEPEYDGARNVASEQAEKIVDKLLAQYTTLHL